MVDANALLKRMLLVAVVSAVSMMNVAYAHGGGHGTGGSSGSGSGSSGSSGGSGHSGGSTSGGHSATASGKSTTASKGSQPARDPVSVSNSAKANATYQNVRVYRIFQQIPSTGYTTQYRETNNDDWRRKHQRLFLGFIRY
jgi:hypothetical protein